MLSFLKKGIIHSAKEQLSCLNVVPIRTPSPLSPVQVVEEHRTSSYSLLPHIHFCQDLEFYCPPVLSSNSLLLPLSSVHSTGQKDNWTVIQQSFRHLYMGVPPNLFWIIATVHCILYSETVQCTV